jgi:uncharacterized protein
MVKSARIEQVLSSIAGWARSRSDILALALVGSRARGAARQDSDIDLIVLAAEPQMFRCNGHWLAEIAWINAHVASWHDADYGSAWSRHVALNTDNEIEFTFCKPSWAATDPIDAGTAGVLSGGCCVLVDKTKLLENLLTAASHHDRHPDRYRLRR